MKRLLLALALLSPVAFVACGNATVQTPAPPDSPDLKMAKSLLVAQTAIEQAKTLIPAHPTFKDQLNQVIAGYNLAETSYLAYHQALAAGNNPDPAAISAQIIEIMTKAQALVASIK